MNLVMKIFGEMIILKGLGFGKYLYLTSDLFVGFLLQLCTKTIQV